MMATGRSTTTAVGIYTEADRFVVLDIPSADGRLGLSVDSARLVALLLREAADEIACENQSRGHSVSHGPPTRAG